MQGPAHPDRDRTATSRTTELINSGKVPVEPPYSWFPFVIEKGVRVRSILICVKTAAAAQVVSTAAARLGLGGLISAAVGGADALARVAETPADLVLVDTASVRPDTVGFTRRVLTHSPSATLVFLGPEEPGVAQATVDAGARGLIRGGEREELVATVAKTLMLLLRPASMQAVPLQRSEVGEDPDGEASETDPANGAGLANGANGTNGANPSTTVTMSLSEARGITLTERELQVLRGMAEGRSNAEIGRELFVSEDTVKTHARRLFRKLGARDRAHAVASAFRAGLVS
jgi:DNA-binding NarL/FixJ family response regulator